MATLPWKTPADAGDIDECVVMASRLQVRRHRNIPTFLRHTLRIRRQLSRTDGMLGNSLKADLASRTFWTVSAWRDSEALAAFNRTNPHRSSVKRIRPAMESSDFVTWISATSDLPIRWSEVRQRLAATTKASS